MKLPTIYKDKDGEIGLIKDKCVAIIGYGNQGRAQALNLLDSGMNVSIGLRKESRSCKMAVDSGLNCTPINDIVKDCDIISLLIPDQFMKEVFFVNMGVRKLK